MDAVGGVEAGRNGGFGTAAGIACRPEMRELHLALASVVVTDFRKLGEALREGNMATQSDANGALPNALDNLEAIRRRLDGKGLAVFLDYDGTLTPIVERPDMAVLSDRMRATLKKLAATCPVAVISGRDRDDVSAMVGVDGVTYAGDHGFDIGGGRLKVVHSVGGTHVPALNEVRGRLQESIGAIDGVLFEVKVASFAIHFRLVDRHAVPRIEAAVREALADRPELRLLSGKMVLEIMPDIDWDKGHALRWLLENLSLDPASNVIVYVGDDVTDEDAFRALPDSGLGIRVLGGDEANQRKTAARFVLRDPDEVGRFLEKLVGDA